MHCKICQSGTATLFTTRVLKKHDVGFHRCAACGFVQTDAPHWLDEAYSSAINDIDIGPVNRAVTGARLIEGVILSWFDKDAKFIDYGGGYGVLVRLMRDRGFDFYWRDPYCQNLFAKHFVAQPEMHFELLTAFEVFEHLADPCSEIGRMAGAAENILFSTLLVPEGVRKAEDWWYFGPEHGQHIAFYTRRSLELIGEKFGLTLTSDGVGMHLLSRKPVSERLFRFLGRDRPAAAILRMLLRRRLRRQSLLSDDFRVVSGHVI